MDKKSAQLAFNKISNELLENSPLSYFGLSITQLLKKEVAFFSNHPGFTIDMFDEKFPFLAPFLQEGYYSLEGIFKKVPERYGQYRLSNIFFVVKDHGDFISFYTFGSEDTKPPMINFYLNNLDFLERFILRFHERAKDVIQLMKESHHTIPHHVDPAFYEELLHERITQEPIIVERYFNSLAREWVTLSERERQILLCAVIHGMTAVKAGEHLKISPKTVESHLESLRRKLSAKSKGELLQRAIDMGLIRLQSYF